MRLTRRVAVHAGIHEPALEIQARHLHRKGRRAIEADGDAVAPFGDARLVFPARPEVQRHAGADPVVVLRVGRHVVDQELGGRRHVDLAARRVAEQEAGDCVAGDGACGRRRRALREPLVEGECAGRGSVDERVGLEVAVIGAELQRVAAGEPGHGRVRGLADVGREAGAVVADRGAGAGPVAGQRDVRVGVEREHRRVGRWEPEAGGVEIQVVAAVVEKVVVAVADRDGGLVVRDPDVVHRPEIDDAVVLAAPRIAGHRRVRSPEGRARLTRVLPAVHPGGRPRTAPPLIDLDRGLRLRSVVEGRLAVVRTPRVWQGHIGQHRAGDRIQPVGRDDVARERIADEAAGAIRARGQGVVDDDELPCCVPRLREVAVALERGGHREHVVTRAPLQVIVLAEPEERAVADDGTANRAGPAVVVLRRFRAARPLGEEQLSAGPLRLVEEEGAAVPLVRAGSRGDVEDAAGGAAHVGVVGLHLDAHVLECFSRRRPRRAVDEVRDRDALDEIRVATPRPAAERQERRVRLILIADELRVAGLNHVRRGDRRVKGVAAEDRQRRDVLGGERRRHRGRGALDQRRLAAHGDLLRQPAYFEREVLHHLLLRRQLQAGSLLGPEPRERGTQGVGAGQHAGEDVLAHFVGDYGSRRARGFVDQGHLGRGDDALRVADDAANRALVGLRESRGRGREKDNRRHEGV